jgi:hypothetical protein
METAEAPVDHDRSEHEQTAHPAATTPRILTHSAMEAWSRCEVEYRWSYLEMVVPIEYPSALAVGSAFHAGAEQLHHRLPLAEAFRIAGRTLDRFVARARVAPPEGAPAEVLDQQVLFDLSRVRAMLRAWFERWFPARDGDDIRHDGDLEIIETESKVSAPLVNPLTGRASRTFALAGKIDGIVRHRSDRYRCEAASGRPGWYIAEVKTTGEDLDEFVEAMTVSAQPAIYQVLAERAFGDDLGPLLGTVLDIVRKPTIRPKKEEAPAEFEQRAVTAYREEPERFLRRVVLPVSPDLRREVLVNAWRIADGIRRAERFGYVSKRGPACRGGYGPCRYRRLCWFNDRTGFVRKQTAHEELADQE